MKKKFLSNAPPALSNAPPGLHTVLTTGNTNALNSTIRDTVHATG